MSGLAARLACRAIREYQLARAGRPPTCRYAPSCSAYALEAVQQHGAVRGAWLAARRLVRCHPLGSMGLDPVPAGRHGPSRGDSVERRASAGLRARAGRRTSRFIRGEAVARAARERSEQERETPPRNATGLRLPVHGLGGTVDV